MSDNDPTGIWQDWRIERDNVVLAREQRDEARQLAVDFKAALESAQRNYTEATEMLKAIGAALNVRTLGEIIPAIEALQEKYNDLSERLVLSITRENAVIDFLGIA